MLKCCFRLLFLPAILAQKARQRFVPITPPTDDREAD